MKRTLGSAAIFASCLLLFSACGSTTAKNDSRKSSTTVSSPGGNGAGAANGITANSITVGGVGQAASYAGLADGFLARIERANRKGGVNGRKIKFLGVEDDNGVPATDLSLTTQLVQKDHVFAVAPVTSAAFLPQSANFLKAHQTPFIGWGILPSFCGNPYGYGFNGCLGLASTVNSAIVAPAYKLVDKPASQVRFAFQSNDDDTGRTGNPQYAAVVKSLGGKIVYDKANIPPEGATTDYSPYAQALIAAKPDVIVIGTDFTGAVGLSAALNAAGYKGVQMSFVAYSPGLFESQKGAAAALEGQYVNIQIPPEQEGSAAVKRIQSDLKAIDKPTAISFGNSLGYWQADVFLQMLAATGRNLTPATFQKTVNADFTYKSKLAGGIGDVQFPKNHNAAVPCAALVQVKDGTYRSAVKFSCYKLIPRKK